MPRNRETLYHNTFDSADYFQYLCELVKGHGIEDFGGMLKVLYETPFIWSHRIPTDENREIDGIQLRIYYCDYVADCETPSRDVMECSVLEMLVALSIKAEELVNDITYYNDDPGKWFFQFCENLDILRHEEEYIDQQVRHWLNRDIGIKGEGSPFRYRRRVNIKHADIWLQLNYYLSEQTGWKLKEKMDNAM